MIAAITCVFRLVAAALLLPLAARAALDGAWLAAVAVLGLLAVLCSDSDTG